MVAEVCRLGNTPVNSELVLQVHYRLLQIEEICLQDQRFDSLVDDIRVLNSPELVWYLLLVI